MDETIAYIIDRFGRGLGATLHKAYQGAKGVSAQSVYLIPEPLCEDGRRGLLIVQVGKGSYIWDGQQKLTPYDLLGKGIQPVTLCNDLAVVCNAVLETLKNMAYTAAPAPLQLAHQPGE